MHESLRPLRPPVHIRFVYVPVARRRDGWTRARQRGFIDALACIGCVAAAARHVGMTPRSAWRLRNRADAKSFARAWDSAADTGRANAYDTAVERALYGQTVPVFRRGVHVGWKHFYDNMLLFRILRRAKGWPTDVPESLVKRGKPQ